MFLKLTNRLYPSHTSGTIEVPVWINSEHITAVEPDYSSVTGDKTNFTRVFTLSKVFSVLEDAELIMKWIGK